MVDVKNSVSKEEWDVRVDLAAFYRTIPYFGWDDLIFTHISAKVPGAGHLQEKNLYILMARP